MDEKAPLAEALRAEILRLASDGALTADVLLRIMRVAKTGRDLLVSLEASPSNLAGMLRRPRSPYALPVVGESMEDDDGGISIGSVYSPAPQTENFGMTAIRELVATAKNLNGPSPSKLVEALAIAREKGLDDVARELEKQLGVGSETKAAAPPVTAQEDKP
jgi:hypothetical protein